MSLTAKNASASPKLHIAFFGTPDFAVDILDELEKAGFTPALVVTNPDKPKGRKLILTPPPTKVWAEKRGIKVVQPDTLRDGKLLQALRKERWDLFVVAAYGKIIPKEYIDLPLHRTLNVHPSLLPKFRGSSPIQSAMIADEKHTGISIMVLDEEMDHGPILGQESYVVKEWPRVDELESALAHRGGALLARLIPQWINRAIEAVPQEHHLATYTKKITKADGLIDLETIAADPYTAFRKIQAYAGWPGAYFMEPDKKRVIISDATFENDELTINKVIPEGRKEMSYSALRASTPSNTSTPAKENPSTSL